MADRSQKMERSLTPSEVKRGSDVEPAPTPSKVKMGVDVDDDTRSKASFQSVPPKSPMNFQERLREKKLEEKRKQLEEQERERAEEEAKRLAAEREEQHQEDEEQIAEQEFARRTKQLSLKNVASAPKAITHVKGTPKPKIGPKGVPAGLSRLKPLPEPTPTQPIPKAIMSMRATDALSGSRGESSGAGTTPARSGRKTDRSDRTEDEPSETEDESQLEDMPPAPKFSAAASPKRAKPRLSIFSRKPPPIGKPLLLQAQHPHVDSESETDSEEEEEEEEEEEDSEVDSLAGVDEEDLPLHLRKTIAINHGEMTSAVDYKKEVAAQGRQQERDPTDTDSSSSYTDSDDMDHTMERSGAFAGIFGRRTSVQAPDGQPLGTDGRPPGSEGGSGSKEVSDLFTWPPQHYQQCRKEIALKMGKGLAGIFFFYYLIIILGLSFSYVNVSRNFDLIKKSLATSLEARAWREIQRPLEILEYQIYYAKSYLNLGNNLPLVDFSTMFLTPETIVAYLYFERGGSLPRVRVKTVNGPDRFRVVKQNVPRDLNGNTIDHIQRVVPIYGGWSWPDDYLRYTRNAQNLERISNIKWVEGETVVTSSPVTSSSSTVTTTTATGSTVTTTTTGGALAVGSQGSTATTTAAGAGTGTSLRSLEGELANDQTNNTPVDANREMSTNPVLNPNRLIPPFQRWWNNVDGFENYASYTVRQKLNTHNVNVADSSSAFIVDFNLDRLQALIFEEENSFNYNVADLPITVYVLLGNRVACIGGQEESSDLLKGLQRGSVFPFAPSHGFSMGSNHSTYWETYNLEIAIWEQQKANIERKNQNAINATNQLLIEREKAKLEPGFNPNATLPIIPPPVLISIPPKPQMPEHFQPTAMERYKYRVFGARDGSMNYPTENGPDGEVECFWNSDRSYFAICIHQTSYFIANPFIFTMQILLWLCLLVPFVVVAWLYRNKERWVSIPPELPFKTEGEKMEQYRRVMARQTRRKSVSGSASLVSSRNFRRNSIEEDPFDLSTSMALFGQGTDSTTGSSAMGGFMGGRGGVMGGGRGSIGMDLGSIGMDLTNKDWDASQYLPGENITKFGKLAQLTIYTISQAIRFAYVLLTYRGHIEAAHQVAPAPLRGSIIQTPEESTMRSTVREMIQGRISVKEGVNTITENIRQSVASDLRRRISNARLSVLNARSNAILRMSRSTTTGSSAARSGAVGDRSKSGAVGDRSKSKDSRNSTDSASSERPPNLADSGRGSRKSIGRKSGRKSTSRNKANFAVNEDDKNMMKKSMGLNSTNQSGGLNSTNQSGGLNSTNQSGGMKSVDSAQSASVQSVNLGGSEGYGAAVDKKGGNLRSSMTSMSLTDPSEIGKDPNRKTEIALCGSAKIGKKFQDRSPLGKHK